MTPPTLAPTCFLTLRDNSPGWGCFWMMLTLVFGSKKGRKEVLTLALGLLPTLDGTKEVPLISPPPLQYLSQAGDELGKVPLVPK